MNYSKQKEEILNLMRSGILDHPRAAEVYIEVKKTLPEIGLATVYRNLNSFVDAGVLRRITNIGDADRYDFRVENHNHAFCVKCKGITDFNYKPDARIDKMLESEFGFQPQSHSYMVNGICEKCLRKDKLKI